MIFRSVDEDGTGHTFRFVHQTRFQQRLLSKYGQEVVVMDSTCKTTKYSIPFFFLSVLTNVAYQVVATLMVGHENTREIAGASEVLKIWNSDWKPAGFMCDLDMSEIHACEQVFRGNDSRNDSLLLFASGFASKCVCYY